MRLKQINFLVLLSLLGALFLVPSAAAAQSPVLHAGNVSAAPGAIIKVPVYLSSRGEVAGAQFELAFDSSMLTYLETGEGELTKGYLVMPARSGDRVKVIITSLAGDTIPAGSASVAQISFRVADSAGYGQGCALELSGVTLADARGQPVMARYNSGRFSDVSRVVKANKSWTVRFNMPVDADTLSQSITVTDVYGNPQKVVVGAADDKTATVSLQRGSSYKSGETYTLEIKTTLRSSTGLYLKNPEVMQFTVE